MTPQYRLLRCAACAARTALAHRKRYHYPHFVLIDAGDYSGYILARMRYDIVLSPQAVQDRRRLRAYDWAIIRDAIEKHLRNEPMKVSKSRIKRLQGVSRPQYRLRVGDFRVFYDVSGTEVQVLAIIPKPEVEAWLREAGEPQ